MGALHAGHVSLVQAAKRDRCWCIVTIFVNPTQFGPNEDFSRYPRDEAGDLARCDAAGADAVFLPEVADMYPPGSATVVSVRGLTDHLCGPARPGHFDGVATIVSKLFSLAQPDRAYFGEKDAQQLAVIRRFARDLDFPIEIVGCPTVREADGLAMSSRNRYLTPEARQRALTLSRALHAAEARFAAGEREVATLAAEIARILAEGRPTKIDYASIVDAETLQPVAGRIERRALVAVAVWFERTRLIDNVTLVP